MPNRGFICPHNLPPQNFKEVSMTKSFAFDDKDMIECKWCKEKTRHLGTGECDGCWELRTRMEYDLTFAEKMLNQLKK